jgi:hypothetical protein
MTRRKYNPARQKGKALANLARSYLRDAVVSEAEMEPLRRAKEALELGVEVLIRAIETGPDERARAGAMHRLAGVMADAFTIGNWHYDDKTLKDRVQPSLRAKRMRESKDEKSKMPQLVQDIINHKWKFKLAKGEPCAKKVAKALGYDVTHQPGYSLSSIRRAIETVLETSSQ